MNYIVPTGLFAIGHPRRTTRCWSPANYKMSFDIVRSTMAGRNGWLLVLETFGINVWCAAGKRPSARKNWFADRCNRAVKGCKPFGGCSCQSSALRG